MSATAVATTAAACCAGESAACATAGIPAACNTSATGVTACCSGISAGRATSIASAISSSISAAIPVGASIAVAAPTVPAPTVPRADADEEAAYEPVRSVITVRRASVGVVRVVAPVADRGTINVRGVTDRRADSDADSDLGICRCR